MESGKRLTGWHWVGFDIWWYGNGQIEPYNWTKQIEDSIKATLGQPVEPIKQEGQLKFEFE
jgi:hypothetical protein